jgi:hypothetical protein
MFYKLWGEVEHFWPNDLWVTNASSNAAAFLNTAPPLKQGSTNILTVIFSISFLQWEAIFSHD